MDSSMGQTSREDTAPFFDKAHNALDSALTLFDKQQQLPAKADLPFYDYLSKTKESQQQKVDDYLDVAAEALGISEINDRRSTIAALRKMIDDSRKRIAQFKRYRISAPESTYNPLAVS